MAERQRPELADRGTEPPCREGGKELALGTAWGPVFTPPRFPWVTGSVFFCSTSFHPSLSQTGGSQLPTQPGLPAGSSAGASSRCPAPPQRQHHGVGAAGSPPLPCESFWGPSPQVLLAPGSGCHQCQACPCGEAPGAGPGLFLRTNSTVWPPRTGSWALPSSAVRPGASALIVRGAHSTHFY